MGLLDDLPELLPSGDGTNGPMQGGGDVQQQQQQPPPAPSRNVQHIDPSRHQNLATLLASDTQPSLPMSDGAVMRATMQMPKKGPAVGLSPANSPASNPYTMSPGNTAYGAMSVNSVHNHSDALGVSGVGGLGSPPMSNNLGVTGSMHPGSGGMQGAHSAGMSMPTGGSGGVGPGGVTGGQNGSMGGMAGQTLGGMMPSHSHQRSMMMNGPGNASVSVLGNQPLNINLNINLGTAGSSMVLQSRVGGPMPNPVSRRTSHVARARHVLFLVHFRFVTVQFSLPDCDCTSRASLRGL